MNEITKKKGFFYGIIFGYAVSFLVILFVVDFEESKEWTRFVYLLPFAATFSITGWFFFPSFVLSNLYLLQT